ncbi:N-formylglutamate amidohydrolase [Sphingomonas gilva]|uniref:N-formylglutamate amidohydrolase n=1 Tax=Sphingomonas gilva TaxID=2305907 RepID=A0A396RPQ2_9SPHN|nr:N-formylglutamate amidohydrolase [Sphingomonas gilva]RHW17242.1 N-formylglutamate amidohydrolase [Sphingomonas gilva]
MTVERIDGHDPGLLIVVDHASAHVPEDIDLGIDPVLLEKHIAIDIGTAPLARALAARLDAPALLGAVSRLVIDLHREPDHHGLIPHVSDGHVIPGNASVDPADRIARFHTPWHDAIAAHRPELFVAVHSFTPELEERPGARPWLVGLLYNHDDRAARIALDLLGAAGILAGDNEPYSGRLLNYTMNRHAEGNGIPYLMFEVRNDLIRDEAGATHWADILAPIVVDVRNRLAQTTPSAT